MQKYFIMTDERTGGTSFTKLFNCCNLKTIHDPQTRTSSRPELKGFKSTNKTNLLLDYCYNNLKIDVIKCCYISYTVNEYKELLDYCISNNINIIILHRNNIYKRSLSQCVAESLHNYYILDTHKKYKSFNIDTKKYINYIVNYNNKITTLTKYLDDMKYYYIFVIHEDIFSNTSNIYKLFDFLELKIIEEKKFMAIINTDYKTEGKNNLIKNLNAINSLNEKYSKTEIELKYKKQIVYIL